MEFASTAYNPLNDHEYIIDNCVLFVKYFFVLFYEKVVNVDIDRTCKVSIFCGICRVWLREFRI